MKVLHIIRTVGIRGGENQLAQLFVNLKNTSQFQNKLLTIFKDPEVDKFFENKAGIKLEHIVDFNIKYYANFIIDLLLYLLLLPDFLYKLFFILKKEKPDVVISHGFFSAITVWSFVKFKKKSKYIYFHRGSKSKAGKHKLFEFLYKPFDAIATVSKASAESLKSLIKNKSLYVIENGIDIQNVTQKQFKPRSNISLITVGQLVKLKRHKLILESLISLKKQHNNFQLKIIGSGPEKTNLERFVKENHLSDNVNFIGQASNVQNLLCEADIFIFASASEGMSNAVLEAMAIGLPSVVVDAPGVSECHVNGQTGYITNANPDDMANHISQLINNPSTSQTMGQEARKRVIANFSIQSNYDRFINMLQKVTG